MMIEKQNTAAGIAPVSLGALLRLFFSFAGLFTVSHFVWM